MNKILVIGDCHVDDEQSLDRFDLLGKFIVKHKPTHIVFIGDFLTLNCLSAWDKDKRLKMEGKRYKAEIDAGNEALDRTFAPMLEYNKERRKRKEKQYKPKLIYIEGNHEDRLTRYLERDPTFLGWVDIANNLKLKQRGFEFISYREYCYIGGIGFTHIPFNKINPISGQDITRKASMVTVDSVVFGHCFSSDTELLTDDGWRSMSYFENGGCRPVATMNKDTKAIEFQSHSGFYKYNNYNKLIHFKNQQSLDHLVTEDHGMVYETQQGNLKYPKAKDWNQTSYVRVGGILERKGLPYTDDQLRLMVWCHTDGHKDRGKYWTFHLKKQRKITRLHTLLNRMGINYTHNKHKIYIGELPDIYTKDIQKELVHANTAQSKVIINEWAETDGTNYSPLKQVQLATNREEVADALQIMCVTNGHKCNISLRGENTYTLNIRYDVQRVQVRDEFNKGTIPYTGDVYCVSVPNGTLLARRNGRVIITQNTHEAHMSNVHKQGQPHLQQIYCCGCFIDKKEDYVHGRVTNYWRGISLLHNWKDGRFDVDSYSLGRLKREYNE